MTAAYFEDHPTDPDKIILRKPYSTDCQNCEYHRQRAQRWREEAYKQAGHPLPDREQEPVACKECHLKDLVYDLLGELKDANLKLSVRAKRTWVGLTYEEQRELYKKHDMDGWGHFYNAIEAKLKEKNT